MISNPSDRVKVTIDLTRLVKNLRTADGSHVGEKTAKSFMNYAGFDLDSDGLWVGPRAELRKFNPGEVVRVEPA